MKTSQVLLLATMLLAATVATAQKGQPITQRIIIGENTKLSAAMKSGINHGYCILHC